mgnify:CR=1 FL=1
MILIYGVLKYLHFVQKVPIKNKYKQVKSETELFFDKLKEFLQTAPKDISYVIMGKGEYNTEALANGILAVKATPEDVSLMISNSISQGPDTFRLSIELGLERSKNLLILLMIY